ncbi:hypothetical protein ACVWWN_001082 [Mycobacterium sp. URHB0021]
MTRPERCVNFVESYVPAGTFLAIKAVPAPREA